MTRDVVNPRWDEGSDGTVNFEAPPFRADRFYVYIAWGDDRARPLYIGKGNRPFTRVGQHLALAKWASEVRSFECRAFLSPKDALEAETAAIYELNPLYNVIRLQPRWVTDRKMLAKMLEREAQRKAQEKVEREFKAALRRARVRIPRVGLPLPSLPVAVPAPHRGKQPRRQRWRDDIFTPDQLAIIARVQNRGRAA